MSKETMEYPSPVTQTVATCCGNPTHVGSPEGYTLECCQNFIVSDRREAIARIIDPHSFLPDNSGDDLTAEMIRQGKDLAFSKADRIIAALATMEGSDNG